MRKFVIDAMLIVEPGAFNIAPVLHVVHVALLPHAPAPDVACIAACTMVNPAFEPQPHEITVFEEMPNGEIRQVYSVLVVG